MSARVMKDSGIEWIGEVPEGWHVKPLGYSFSQRKNKNTGMACDNLLSLSYGTIIRKSIENAQGLVPENYEGYNIVEPGDIVLRLTDLQNDHRSLRTGLVRERGIITSAYVTIIPDDAINSRYAHHFLHAMDLAKVLYAMGEGMRQSIKYEDLKTALLLLPAFAEQQAIADYLDEKCAQIDEEIAKRQTIIEKLEEYRTSIISHAVTKGLNPDAPMKDSGVEWIGEVPKEWSILYPKALFRPRKEKARNDDIMLTASQQHGMISQDEFINSQSYTPVQVIKGKDILKHAEPGDFVISMRSFQGGLEFCRVRGKISSAYIALEPVSESVNASYYRWLLKSHNYVSALRSTSNLIREGQALRFANFIQVYLPVPPAKDQQAIADYLDDKCAKIDHAIALQNHAIEKLQEYRKSLIYHAVTGKIDCRDKEAAHG